MTPTLAQARQREQEARVVMMESWDRADHLSDAADAYRRAVRAALIEEVRGKVEAMMRYGDSVDGVVRDAKYGEYLDRDEVLATISAPADGEGGGT